MMVKMISYNSLNHLENTMSDFSRNSPRNHQVIGSLNKTLQKMPILSDSNTVNWLKKRYNNKAHSKYLLMPDELDSNKNLNRIFAFFADNQMKLSIYNLQRIFEFCKIPINLRDLLKVFGVLLKKNICFEPYIEKNSNFHGFICLKDFKQAFNNEKSEAIFKKSMKKLKETYITPTNDDENTYFFPNSLKEVIDYTIYKLNREKIIRKINEEKPEISLKLKGLTELFQAKDAEKHKTSLKTIKNAIRKGNAPGKQCNLAEKSIVTPLIRKKFEFYLDEDEEYELQNLKEDIEKEKNMIKNKVFNEIVKQTDYMKIDEKGRNFNFNEEKKTKIGFNGIGRKKSMGEQEKNMEKIMDFNMMSARSSYEVKIMQNIIRRTGGGIYIKKE